MSILASDRARADVRGSWARWTEPETQYTVGLEEEVMLLEAADLSLSPRTDVVAAGLSPELLRHTSQETHAGVLELRTEAHLDVAGAISELRALRRRLAFELRARETKAACAGMHPLPHANETRTSSATRYRFIVETMRCLARREPTMALHVHVAVSEPNRAIAVLRRMREHVPLFVALAANSPFSQGQDTGFASTRTVTFDGFPRTGPPRAYASYDEYIEAIDPLLASGALPDPTFLWWDIRLQPALGTVEVRVMDAQATIADVAPLAALVQSLARLELEDDPLSTPISEEVLAENRFLAARDGLDARLVDPATRKLRSARALVRSLVEQCRPHAAALGCSLELERANDLAAANGAIRQRTWILAGRDLASMLARLSEQFAPPLRRPPNLIAVDASR